MADDTRMESYVEDHAYRMFKHLHGIDDDVTVLPFDPARALPPGKLWTESDGRRYAMLPSYFVTALEMTALDHMRMSAVVQPFIDTAISKTVNVPVDYPFEEFEDLYLEAWRSGLKGLTTYRPNTVIGSVLEVQQKASGDDAFEMALPPSGEKVRVPSLVSGFARLIRYRCNELGAFGDEGKGKTPVVDALIGRKEPKAGPDGTLSWTVDVINHNTGDDLVLFLKELVMPDGQRRPYSMWLSGEYPRVLDGLCKALSLDMRVWDPAWIGMKLRKLLNYAETNGSFLARIPGSDKAQNWPSTIAYLAQLMIHRYAMLGILTEEGYPVAHAGILEVPRMPACATG